MSRGSFVISTDYQKICVNKGYDRKDWALSWLPTCENFINGTQQVTVINAQTLLQQEVNYSFSSTFLCYPDLLNIGFEMASICVAAIRLGGQVGMETRIS